MLNGKENKYIQIKGMVLTGTPECPMYSGGTVTAYHPEAYSVEVKENHPERSWGNISKPVFDAGK
ncbi:hypothetical protein [Klebsiella pneumoniae]|uniref:hypothetical protein n=1 Tax=Klebsiella pneumoniae TaxID=573 RepID=UPI0013157709|nr:hypothetical protein [Klebsiella pneumoniae]EMB5965476.1 hypothetical protein [Klebsiella pneumoniae]MBV0453782.1 hypothetical protein [Klebsiella pneumoniae]